jgi:hypothetical protein
MTTSDYQPQQFVTPPPAPAGPVTAWDSIPKFIRFSVWLYAIFTVVGLAIWPILIFAILAA